MKYQKHVVPKKYLIKWQEIVDFMAEIFDVPAGLIMRVLPKHIEVLVSSRSEGNPYKPNKKAELNTGLYCETVMTTRDLLHVPNAVMDVNWKDNPDVELSMISYLGIPLIWPNGEIFGTICVLDDKTRKYSKTYQDLLWHFKGIIEDYFRFIEQRNELKREVKERKLAEVQIKKNLREKEILLKEVNHRVKNNMTIISSLLSLQSYKIRDKQALAALDESRYRIRTIALIHEKLYKSKSLADVDFAVYVKDLSNYLFKSYNMSPEKIKLKLDIRDVKLGVSQGIPCGLIINELISNSLKHAFPDGRAGEIGIELKNENNHYRLTVWDNGIGIPETVDAENTDSLGLQLIQIFNEQLDGKLEIERNNGTMFTFTFPQ